MMNIPVYNQLDPRWANKVMAPSSLLLGPFGCYVTCVAMALHNYAKPFDPGQLCDKLIENDGFTKDGLLKYDGIENAFPDVLFYERGYTTNDPGRSTQKTRIETALGKIRTLIRYGMPTILAVDNAKNDGIPDHAVLAVECADDMSDLRIHDPDGGRDILFSQKYGNPRENLHGWIGIIGSPIEVPEGGDSKLGQVTFKLAQARKGILVNQRVKEALDTLLSQ